MTDTQNGGDSCWHKGTLICSPISCRKQDGADSTWQAGRVSTLPPTPSGRLGQLATVGLGQIKDKVVYWLKKNKSACRAGNLGSMPGLRRPPGEGNGSPSSILSGESHRRRSLATVQGLAELETAERLTLIYSTTR